jgi:hypothetical protein
MTMGVVRDVMVPVVLAVFLFLNGFGPLWIIRAMGKSKPPPMPKHAPRLHAAICKSTSLHLKRVSDEINKAKTSGVGVVAVKRLQREYDTTLAHYNTMKCAVDEPETASEPVKEETGEPK